MNKFLKCLAITMLFTVSAQVSWACHCDGAPIALSYVQTADQIAFSGTKGQASDCGDGYSMLLEIKPTGVPFDGTNLLTGPLTMPLGIGPYADFVLTNAEIEAAIGVFPSYNVRISHTNPTFGNCGLFFDNGTTFSLAAAVPTLGQWGLIILVLGMMILSVVAFSRINKVATKTI
jgi:hypothetical protein